MRLQELNFLGLLLMFIFKLNISLIGSNFCKSSIKSLFGIYGKHRISGYECDEIEITLQEKNNDIDGGIISAKKVTIIEAGKDAQESIINEILESNDVNQDPYGSVLWPSSFALSKRLLDYDYSGIDTIVEIGAGTGLVSLTAALFCNKNIKQVLATDINPLSLELINYSWNLQRGLLSETLLKTFTFDVNNFDIPLPEAELVIIGDLLYDYDTSISLARRVVEALDRGSKILLCDSALRPGRPFFIKELERLLPTTHISFKMVSSVTVTGYRHDLICSTVNTIPKQIETYMLELP